MGEPFGEELELAVDCLRDKGSPMRQVVVFFKPPDPEALNTMSFQLKQVLETPPSVWPEQRLANEVAHRRARRYLSHEKEWFQ